MGHNVYTRLYIGGPITRAMTYTLGQKIDDDFYDLQHDGDTESVASAFDHHHGKGEPALFLGETNYGLASDVCRFLAEHGIAYRREAADDGDGPEGTIFDPKAGQSSIDIDTDGEVVVTLPQLRKMAEEGKTLADVLAEMEPQAWMPPAVRIWAEIETAEYIVLSGKPHIVIRKADFATHVWDAADDAYDDAEGSFLMDCVIGEDGDGDALDEYLNHLDASEWTAPTFNLATVGQDERAGSEGWGIFVSDVRGPEIQANDESEIFSRDNFSHDDDAEAWVQKQADAESVYHIAALRRLAEMKEEHAGDDVEVVDL
jgi:hypothetical protein